MVSQLGYLSSVSNLFCNPVLQDTTALVMYYVFLTFVILLSPVHGSVMFM